MFIVQKLNEDSKNFLEVTECFWIKSQTLDVLLIYLYAHLKQNVTYKVMDYFKYPGFDFPYFDVGMMELDPT